jgi:hypothetical protein
MRENERKRAGKKNVQAGHLVRDREAFLKRQRVLASPLGGLQVIAAHLNELPGQRAQAVNLKGSDWATHLKDEVDAWRWAEHLVTQPLAQAVDLFNAQARQLPVLMQVELAPKDPHSFLAPLDRGGDRQGDMLRHLWWYYFHGNVWTRLKRCPVCRAWFVDTSKNKVTARCSARCTAQWWSRSRRKEAGHTLTIKRRKSHGPKARR